MHTEGLRPLSEYPQQGATYGRVLHRNRKAQDKSDPIICLAVLRDRPHVGTETRPQS
jgi:hypothetical protein